MKVKDVDNIWRKYKSILTVPAGFGKMPLAEKVKILNKLARSKTAGMANFVRDYDELREQSKKAGPSKTGGKGGGGGGVSYTGRTIKAKGPGKTTPPAPWTGVGGLGHIIAGRKWIDPKTSTVASAYKIKQKEEAKARVKEAKDAASNILNITLDNVIAQVEKKEQDIIKKKEKKARSKRKGNVKRLLEEAEKELAEQEERGAGSDRYSSDIDRAKRTLKMRKINVEKKIWRLDSEWAKQRYKDRKERAPGSAPPPDMRNWYVQQYNIGGGGERYGDFDINKSGRYNAPGPWVPRGGGPMRFG